MIQLYSVLSEQITISGVILYTSLYSDVPQDGQTALIRAAQNGHTETVSVLLEAGADVNLQEKVREPVYCKSMMTL